MSERNVDIRPWFNPGGRSDVTEYASLTADVAWYDDKPDRLWMGGHDLDFHEAEDLARAVLDVVAVVKSRQVGDDS